MRRALAAAMAMAVMALGACSTGSEGATPATTAPTTSTSTTTTLPTAPWPLTGLPTTDLAAVTRPVVVVKMDNQPEARPQSGLNQADVVYELLIEGFTRFAAVFHSQSADPVGPVRSARSSDIDLISNLGEPVLAFSGGNPGVIGEVREAASAGLLVEASHGTASAEYWRSDDRRIPHNLYTNVSSLRESYGPRSTGSVQPLFSYRPPLAPVGAPPSAGLTVRFGGGMNVDFVWDEATKGWTRFQVDQRHSRADSVTLDPAGIPVSFPNVVVLFVRYGSSPSDPRSPMAITTGEGDALVLTDGKLVTGYWTRPDPSAGWTLTDTAGAPIALTPGPSWVALPQTGSVVDELDPMTAQEILATAGGS